MNENHLFVETLNKKNFTEVVKLAKKLGFRQLADYDNWTWREKRHGNKTGILFDKIARTIYWDWLSSGYTRTTYNTKLATTLKVWKNSKPSKKIVCAGYDCVFSHDKSSVSLGCQTVDRNLVAEIAKRLGYKVIDTLA